MRIALAITVRTALPPTAPPDLPDAKVEFSGGSVAAGIGYIWGAGTLIYQGRLFRLQVSALSIAVLGPATPPPETFTILAKPENIAGTYAALTAGAPNNRPG